MPRRHIDPSRVGTIRSNPAAGSSCLRNVTGEVVTKTDILRAVWDAHYEGEVNVVEVYVGYLRRKIDTPFGTRSIDTVRGVGYRMTEPG